MKSLLLIVNHHTQVLLGNGLVIDPATGHTSESTLATLQVKE
jgi:hypothetical protein